MTATHPRSTVEGCLRVPRAAPAVCVPGAGPCVRAASSPCAADQRALSHYEALERFPAVYARELTDAQVEELISIAEHGGSRYPDGSAKEVYARLKGKAGRKPPSFRESPAFGFGKHWIPSKIVRPALIEPRSDERRPWALTHLGRAVLACFWSLQSPEAEAGGAVVSAFDRQTADAVWTDLEAAGLADERRLRDACFATRGAVR